jgi:hypothetical protein
MLQEYEATISAFAKYVIAGRTGVHRSWHAPHGCYQYGNQLAQGGSRVEKGFVQS